MEEKVSIPEFYKGKNVFITGGTGFMGKVLVEKLLRSCPDVNQLYLLIRGKKGVGIHERWKKLEDIELFKKLKQTNPKAFDKITLIEGTIDKDGLGLSETDKNILQEHVDIVFHGAAAIQFTEDLVYSLRQNTCGAYNVANFAKSMKNFKSFVYSSTAYSNCDKTEKIEEKIYPSNCDYNALLGALESDPYAVAVLRDKIKGKHPSTYTFTKALAEDIMNDFSQYYPVVVSRPALVLGTAEEPIAGWADILNGLTSTFLSVTMGLIRVMQTTPTAGLDYISADHAIKALIISAWKNNSNGTKRLEVVNCNYGKELNAPMGCFFDNGNKMREYYSSGKAVWYPFVLRVSNPFLYTIALFVLQIIPSYAADLALKLAGKRPMLVNITMKYVQAFHGPLKEFLFRQFLFPNDNFKNLNNLLLDEDKKEFAINYSHYTWWDLFMINAESSALYFLKEDMTAKTLVQRRAHTAKLYKIHVAVCALFISMAVYSLYKIILMIMP